MSLSLTSAVKPFTPHQKDKSLQPQVCECSSPFLAGREGHWHKNKHQGLSGLLPNLAQPQSPRWRVCTPRLMQVRFHHHGPKKSGPHPGPAQESTGCLHKRSQEPRTAQNLSHRCRHWRFGVMHPPGHQTLFEGFLSVDVSDPPQNLPLLAGIGTSSTKPSSSAGTNRFKVGSCYLRSNDTE